MSRILSTSTKVVLRAARPTARIQPPSSSFITSRLYATPMRPNHIFSKPQVMQARMRSTRSIARSSFFSKRPHWAVGGFQEMGRRTIAYGGPVVILGGAAWYFFGDHFRTIMNGINWMTSMKDKAIGTVQSTREKVTIKAGNAREAMARKLEGLRRRGGGGSAQSA